MWGSNVFIATVLLLSRLYLGVWQITLDFYDVQVNINNFEYNLKGEFPSTATIPDTSNMEESDVLKEKTVHTNSIQSGMAVIYT